MANNLQNALSSLLSINTNLWNKVSGIIDDNYIFYKSPTSGNLSNLIHGNDGNQNIDGSNWLDLNAETQKLEVRIPYGTKSIHGLLKVGDNISVTNGQISVPIASQSTAGVIKLGSGLKASSDGVVSVVANGVVMDEAAHAQEAEIAKSTLGTLTIGELSFNGSTDVTIDLSNTIELSSVQSIPPSSTTSTNPKLLYTPNGQTAIITSTGVISTSEEITDEITASAAKKITTAEAVSAYVSAYVDDKIANAASKVSISKETTVSGTTLSWTIDGVPGEIEIEKEKWMKQATYNPSSNEITFTLTDDSSFTMDATSLIKDYVAGAGLQRDEATNTINIVKDNNTDSKFLQVGDNTIGLSGITDAINAATSGAIELKYEPSIPENVTDYTHPTLIFTDDGETAIIYNGEVIPTSEKTVESIEEDTPSSYIITVGAFKEYLNNEFADLLEAANALNAEIKK